MNAIAIITCCVAGVGIGGIIGIIWPRERGDFDFGALLYCGTGMILGGLIGTTIGAVLFT